MSSDQEYRNRLREEIRRALSEQISGFAAEIHALQKSVASTLERLSRSLEDTRDLSLPGAETMLEEAIRESRSGGERVPALLSDYSRQLRTKETQEDILELLLDGAHGFAPCAVLFVSRGDKLAAWSSRGYSKEVARQLKKFSLAQKGSPILQKALKSQSPQTIDELAGEKALSDVLRGEAGAPWHAIPLKALGRSLAVLLVSSKPDRAYDLLPLSVIVDSTELCIENLALKILQELSVSGAPAEQPAVKHREDEVAAVSDEEVSLSEAPPPSAEVVEAVAAEASPAVAQPDEAVAEVEAPAETASSSPGIAAATAPQEAVMEAPEEVFRMEAAPEPPKDPAEEEKLHSDAKRFARLLVDEIKLYNEQRVAEGRQNRDLYVRLKRDIDRSRDMYEKRVAPVVARKVDYFHDELIRILGENDLSKLGSDYPGPRVES